MFQIISMLVASSGLALTTAGPDCAASKECPMSGAKTASMSCCDSGSEECCTEKKAAAYQAADWPAHNTDLYSNDFQGQTLPVALGSETWLSEKLDLEGKVVVLDFWATWCGPCPAASPILDQLQRENPDTLAVLAIAGQRDPQSKVQSYIDKHEVAYANLYAEDQAVYKEFESKGIPLVVVMSTDGVIRWIGNPHDDAFLPAVNQTLAVDPALQADMTTTTTQAKTATLIDG